MIHPTAIIDKSACIAKNVTIGPYSCIGPNVEIGEETVIASHAVINGQTKIGKGNKIYQFASIGEDPQDKKYDSNSESRLEVGDYNIFRESTTINRGTANGGGVTKIGNHNLFMSYVHIAHDCNVGSHVIFSNSASLAGHVKIEDYANLSGFVGVHQFCAIGERAFVAGGAVVLKNVPPYVIVSGYPARAFGINAVGLKRAGFSEQVITNLKRAYKILYRQNLSLESAIEKIDNMAKELKELIPFITFLKENRERSIIR